MRTTNWISVRAAGQGRFLNFDLCFFLELTSLLPLIVSLGTGSSRFTLSPFNKLRERKTSFSLLQYIRILGKYLGPAWIMCLSFGPIILDLGGEVLWLVRPRLNDYTWVGVGRALSLTVFKGIKKRGSVSQKEEGCC